MGTTTRQTINDFKAHLKDEDICIIPNDFMKMMLDINTNHQDQLVESQNRIATALERIATSMETQSEHTNAVLDKLDLLNTTISGGTTILADAQKNVDQASVEADLDKLVNDKKRLEWQFMRSKDLSRYYRELLQMEPPFAPEKCRTKVFKNQVTRESIKRIHIEETIHNVETQIRIMETNMVEWRSELDSNEQETNTKLDFLGESKRNGYTAQIRENEEKNISSWKIAFSKITKQYQDEMQ